MESGNSLSGNYKRVYLGIDPAFDTMGAAIFFPESGTLRLGTDKLMNIYRWIKSHELNREFIAVVENPSLIPITFGAWKKHQETVINYLKFKNIGKVKTSFDIAMRHSQNVGKNMAAAELIIDLLLEMNIPVIEISPAKRDRADKFPKHIKNKVDMTTLRMPTKTNKIQFEQLTGYKGKSTEHSRDSATLIWGRSLKWAETQIFKK